MLIDHVVNTSGTLVPATGAQIAASQAPNCSLLIVANNGTNPMVIKFGSAPTSAIDGIPLDGAATAGGQGGSLMLTGDDISRSDAVYGYSALGTTFAVAQGVVHP
jgi:hypothetical protein